MNEPRDIMELLLRHEGERLKPYRCSAGKLTIGVGHNLDDNGIPKHISDALLMHDLAECLRELRANFPWFEKLNDARRAAVTDMVFNMGLPAFKKFKNTIRFIEADEFENASMEMLDSKWAREDVSPDRSGRLSIMMRTGEWP